MANENIGDMTCYCGRQAHVRKNKNHKFYLMCDHCGQQAMNLPGGQDTIMSKAAIYGDTKPAPKVETVTQEPAAPPAPPEDIKPKKQKQDPDEQQNDRDWW